jgi:hypothetical protein
MRTHKHLFKSLFGKAALATAALGGFLSFAGAPGAQAHDRDEYRHDRDGYRRDHDERRDYRHDEYRRDYRRDDDRFGRYEDWRRHEAFEHRGYYGGYYGYRYYAPPVVYFHARPGWWCDRYGCWHRY